MKICHRIEGESWCGPAALSWAAEQLGVKISQVELAEAMGTTKELGTSPEQMLVGAFVAGLHAIARENCVLESVGSARAAGLAIIVDWMAGGDWNTDGHYSCVEWVDRYQIALNDSELGGQIRIFDKDNFDSRWFDFEGEKEITKWAMFLSL